MHMLRDADRAYAALHDQFEQAYDGERRLRCVGEICNQVRDEYVLAHQRVQALIERVAARLDPGGV